MEYKVKFTPHLQLGKLESIHGRRYSNEEIARAMAGNVTRQVIYYQLNTSLEEVKVDMIAKWLKFLNEQGLNVVIGDLFSVTSERW